MLDINVSVSLREATDGAASISVEAKTIRELFRKIVDDYPRMSAHLEQGVAVSINGRIFRDNWGEEIPERAEIFLLPRISGG